MLINARTLTPRRIQIVSHDGGFTFDQPYIPEGLTESIEGCEGSTIFDSDSNILYYSGVNGGGLFRRNMTVFYSSNEGLSWNVLESIDGGAVSYSALQLLPNRQIGLLYERSNTMQLVFEPDEIVFYKLHVVPV